MGIKAMMIWLVDVGGFWLVVSCVYYRRNRIIVPDKKRSRECKLQECHFTVCFGITAASTVCHMCYNSGFMTIVIYEGYDVHIPVMIRPGNENMLISNRFMHDIHVNCTWTYDTM